jgi:hypothetical protein
MMERASHDDGREQFAAFCTKCGALNISACQHCQALIEYRYGGDRPSYCGGCGKSFPWTEVALSAAKEYTDELDQLSPEERTTLKRTLDDLSIDTDRTPLAANRIKKFMDKIGPSAAGLLNKFVEVVATAAAKKMLGI